MDPLTRIATHYMPCLLKGYGMDVKKLISELDFSDIKRHYDLRCHIHVDLLKLLKEKKNKKAFCELALGIIDSYGNFSANNHNLGPKILLHNSYDAIFTLADKLNDRSLSPQEIAKIIYTANLCYLKISIGTEISALLHPDLYWVANVRTIWGHLLVKHKGDLLRANEELSLYRDDDRNSEMHYKIWSEIYRGMKSNLLLIGQMGEDFFYDRKSPQGIKKFLWADVICSELYDHYSLAH